MGRSTRILRPVLLCLLGLYLFIWPGSTLLVALGRVPVWGTWIGGALLILLGLLVGLWLCANYGRRGAVVAAAILLVSWAVEHLGVTTGFPFGSYGYTGTLQPKLLGAVPLAIPFAWLLVVPAAVGVAERLLGGSLALACRPRLLLTLKVLVAAWLALLLDMTIEPVAVHVNGYWVWFDRGAYYGVPASNFVAWWATSALLVALLLFVVPPSLRGGPEAQATRPYVLPLLPPALYMLNLLMFALINLAHNQFVAGGIGTALLAALVLPTGLLVLRPLRRSEGGS